jgi:hypothetical protein
MSAAALTDHVCDRWHSRTLRRRYPGRRGALSLGSEVSGICSSSEKTHPGEGVVGAAVATQRDRGGLVARMARTARLRRAVPG